jgi:hypothetical protein
VVDWKNGEEKRKQLKAKTILERKRINCKIMETGVEIVSEFKGKFDLFLLKTYSSTQEWLYQQQLFRL